LESGLIAGQSVVGSRINCSNRIEPAIEQQFDNMGSQIPAIMSAKTILGKVIIQSVSMIYANLKSEGHRLNRPGFFPPESTFNV
jgi:hypothetical protein